MRLFNIFLPLVLLASSVLPGVVTEPQISTNIPSHKTQTDGIKAAEKLFQLLSKRHLNHLQPGVYKKSESERLLENSLEVWDPDKQFFVEQDIPRLRMHIEFLSGRLLAVNFHLATALQDLIEQRGVKIQHYLTESFQFEHSNGNVQKISALRTPEHYFPDIPSLLDSWDKIARYQILKECHDSGNQAVRPDSACYQGAIHTLMDRIKTMAEPLPPKDIQEKHLQAYAASFGPYTAYAPQADSSKPLNYYGMANEFGVQVSLSASGDIIIESIHSMEKSGNSCIEPGDILIRVNDEEPIDISERNKLVEMYPGNNSLKLTLRRNGTLYTATVTKQEARSSSGHLYSQTFDNGTILYLRIPSFYDRKKESSSATMADSVQAIIDEWQHSVLLPKGMIIDLRQNGGGAVFPALDVLSLFLNDTVVLQIRNSKGVLYPITPPKNKKSFTGEIVVLVDEETASSSEIFSAALQDYGVALIAGSRTYGKGFMQETQSLKTGTESTYLSGRATITSGQLYRATGVPLHKDGVTPDIEIYRSPDVSRTDTTLPWKDSHATVPNHTTIYTPVIYKLFWLQDRSTERLRGNDTFLQRQQWADQHQLYMETGIELTPEDVHRYVLIKRNYEKGMCKGLNIEIHTVEEDIELAEGIMILKDMIALAE